MLIDHLETVARIFVFERAKQFAGSEFGNFVRKELPMEARKLLVFLPYELKLKSSVGQSRWAAVPWLAFFDPLVTESATTGYYVVFLINAQTEEITLSLNQGTTEVYQEFGEARGREILRRRAQDIRARVSDFASNFDKSPIDLGSPESLPKGYEAGHAFGRTYKSGQINKSEFTKDFENMLAAYSALVERGGTTPMDVLSEDNPGETIEETRKYAFSRRIERAKSVRKKVLAQRGIVCEGCGLSPEIHYGYKGPLINAPLDVHHIKPISGLAEGETRRYKIPEDFLVLCPNCHRVIHKQDDPSKLDDLRKTINFLYAERKTRGFF